MDKDLEYVMESLDLALGDVTQPRLTILMAVADRIITELERAEGLS